MALNAFSQFLKHISPKPLSVLDLSIPPPEYISLNLSVNNQDLVKVDVSSSEKLGIYINNHIKKHQAEVAYGGYLERRNIYQRSSYFNSTNPEAERNIHLGMDLWIAAGTPVCAPVDGWVHSFKNNTNHGDYGPTIILKHQLETFEFFTLYGHLSVASIKNLKIGQKFHRGEHIATLGNSSVNGDYAPHLHFQIIKNIGDYKGDYPGVCSQQDLAFFKENCPDPNLLLKLE